MGWWQVNADTLAGSRFVLSPLAETFACLKALHVRSAAHPGERVWLNAHLPRYAWRLASDPVTSALVRAGFGREWIADFLTPTPRGDEDFATEVARVRGASPEAARAHLAVALRGPLPEILRDRDDLPERAADLLTHVWTEAVRPDWRRRRRVLEADVVARTARLSQEGWAAALGSMRPGMRWLGENRLQVNLHEYPPREISGARIVFVPVTPQRHGWVSWEEPRQRPHPETTPHRYGVVYPCSGVLAQAHQHEYSPSPVAVPDSLTRLLGGARARVLVLLGSPMSACVQSPGVVPQLRIRTGWSTRRSPRCPHAWGWSGSSSLAFADQTQVSRGCAWCGSRCSRWVRRCTSRTWRGRR
ncbi:transcriptional regulator [Streptomyces sp. NPDC087844]|uniref:transcriptional regulator n=1 Tax=Streptomyces sp. NPDC087844 TaxID=3365805 RepID=UPI003818F8EC